jgi:hypothetical protein
MLSQDLPAARASVPNDLKFEPGIRRAQAVDARSSHKADVPYNAPAAFADIGTAEQPKRAAMVKLSGVAAK